MRRLYNTAVRTWLLVLLAACHSGNSPDKDRDNDGVEDQFDICPGIADEDQADADNDGTGDACDDCPLDAHDEDHDGHDDPCDVCPGLHILPFDDRDNDELLDDCDPFTLGAMALPSWQRLFFDPFVSLAPEWQPKTVPWDVFGDAARPRAPLDSGDGLLHTTLLLPATVHVDLGIDSRGNDAHWAAGEQFGIRLVDATGAEQAACLVSCATSDTCRTSVRVGAASAEVVAFYEYEPYLRLVIDPDTQRTYCVLDSPKLGSAAQVMSLPPTGTKVVLVASPTSRVTYLDVVAHGQ
jgi:hypothetical protein